MDNYLNDRIQAMFVSKIFEFNSSIKNNFKIRNNSTYPELTKQIVQKAIRDLRVWRHLLSKLDNETRWNIQKELDNFNIK